MPSIVWMRRREPTSNRFVTVTTTGVSAESAVTSNGPCGVTVEVVAPPVAVSVTSQVETTYRSLIVTV